MTAPLMERDVTAWAIPMSLKNMMQTRSTSAFVSFMISVKCTPESKLASDRLSWVQVQLFLKCRYVRDGLLAGEVLADVGRGFAIHHRAMVKQSDAVAFAG